MIILGFDWPLALVIGAVLAPTDPVLASEVQLRSAQDRDSLRFGLTGEGGLNDGTAFPFVLLGLGAMGLHDLGWMGWRWVAVDLVWGIGGGLGIGFLVGTAIARGVRRLRAWRRDAFIIDEFLLLGVIALSYGVALAAGALGFLAVFAAGLALRRADDIHANAQKAADKPPLTPSMLNVNEQLERIVEVAIVLLVGAMISTGYWSLAGTAAGRRAVCRRSARWLCGSAFAKQDAGRCAAPPAGVVWHSRHWIGVLRGVFRRLRAPRCRRHGSAVRGVHGDRGFHRAARHFRRPRSWSCIARAAVQSAGREVPVSDK